ncbi:hypothetical protein POM88_015561 [Heracleum sosnowskyi]|uniref:Uncharacterized protein n=1 Tax=Heracleum sosnowskyi TaxID=360622 RepID=A0AAD8ILN4_9APIA|nr:hypothetical protein POM88_015561 [Heracleum sosnowskyi]
MEIKNSEERPCYSNWKVMKSPEIVEIDDNSKCCVGSTYEGIVDVFFAVGKNDINVLKWALNHVVLPGNRILLVHVYSHIAYIPTLGNTYSSITFKTSIYDTDLRKSLFPGTQ